MKGVLFDATEEEEEEDTAELDETEEAVVEEDTVPPAAGTAIDESHSRRTADIDDEDEGRDEDMAGGEMDLCVVGKE